MANKEDTTKGSKVVVPDKTVDLGSPIELANFAQQLKKYVVQNGLVTKIQNKLYVNVEGWQFCGAVTGILPIVRRVSDLPGPDGEIKYRAEVELVSIAKELTVGYGVAICSNKEAGKTKFDEYAIASMAQTRATGKAYRNAFAWLMKMAGYEATPAEEATGMDGNPANLEPETVEKIQNAKSGKELLAIFGELSAEEKQNAEPLISAKTEELKNAARSKD